MPLPRLPPHDPGHEEDAGLRREGRQRQDGGRRGGAPGPAPQVQAPGQDQEALPGPRPREQVQGWGLRSAGKGSAH